MKRDDDRRDLLRLLAGELTPGRAAALRARLAREPALAAAWRRLESAWRAAAPPPPAPVPPGFAATVMARLRREAAGTAPLSWALAPAWVRAAGAAAVAAGIVAGAGLGSLRQPPAPPPAVAPAGNDDPLLAPSLAEEYLAAVGWESR